MRGQIASLTRRWRGRSPAGLRWVDAAQAHLTLAFLGDLDADAIERVQASARTAARAHAPIPADLRAAGAFPHPDAARVLWLGWGRGSADVVALQRSLRHELTAAGLRLESRRFAPHVTLARARAPGDLRAVVEALAPWRSEPWTVGAVDVMASRLTQTGAVHTLLERCPLGRP